MKFVAPEIDINLFSTEDILTTSIETTTYELFWAPDCPAELPMD